MTSKLALLTLRSEESRSRLFIRLKAITACYLAMAPTTAPMSTSVHGGHLPARCVLSRRGEDTHVARHVASTEDHRHGEDSQHEQVSRRRGPVNVEGEVGMLDLFATVIPATAMVRTSLICNAQRPSGLNQPPGHQRRQRSEARHQNRRCNRRRRQTVTSSHSILGCHGTRDATSWMNGIDLPSGKRRAHWKSGCRRVIARSALRYSGRCPRPIVP